MTNKALPSDKLPDLLALIPEGNPKLILRYCFDTLQLSIEETDKAISATSKLISSIDWLLRAGEFPTGQD
jgi:hypothetical protein